MLVPRLTSVHPASVQNPISPQKPPPASPRWFRIALAVCLIAAGAALLHHLMIWVQNMIGGMNTINEQGMMNGLLIAALVLYAVLIAFPFMPGVEVGIALLMMQGAQIAPFVYLATVSGLMLAYVIGRLVPLCALERFFLALGLRKAAAFVVKMQDMTPAERLAQQRAVLPGWLAKLTIEYRYLTIGVLLNVPGTFAIGGGGGILMAAGLSRLFNGWVILLTLLVATLPVPLTVWVMGTSFGWS